MYIDKDKKKNFVLVYSSKISRDIQDIGFCLVTTIRDNVNDNIRF